MSKRLKLSDLAKVVAQKAATSASKGVVISEGSETTSGKRALDDESKGKQVAQSPEPKKARIDTGASRAPAKPPIASGAGSSAHRTLGEALGPQASVMASAATAEKILAGVILPADKEKVDKLTFDQVVTKFLHALDQGLLSPFAAGTSPESALNQKAVAESAEMEMVRTQNRAIELEGALAEEKAKGKKLAEDADARSKVIAKLEARISELEKSQSLTQGRIIAAFKESDDFLEAVRGLASSYFGDGFDFCKRQLAHQYPDLGVDLEDVEMDHEFLAKEEAEAEQRAAEEGAAGAEGVGCPCMFTKINLGGEESEQSLPSWISDHLGAKSYIDETSQSPSSPPPNSPQMDTSSLTKEGNVMTQAELDKLRSTYSFPSGMRLLIPGDGRDNFVNSPRRVICSLVIWRHFKRHMSCDEFRCLYSLSPLPDSGWYYFKARPEKNLFRGSPSNVKGWKTRFFFASGDEWEFLSGTAASNTLRVPRSWGTPEDGGNPREDRARRLLRGFEGPGFTDVQKILCDWVHGALYQRRRQHDLGDEGEFVTREDSVEYLGVIRRDIGGVIRRALPGIPDETLLRLLGGKVKDPFTNLLSGTSGSSSDLGSVSISDSELPPELRSDAMSVRAGAPAFGEKTGGKAKAKKATKATTAKPPTKGIGSESMSDASVARRLLTGVIPASDKEEVDRLTENDLAAKFHALGQPGNEVDDLKATVAELTNKLAKAKELAIEDFKASGEFKAAVTDSAATYFSEGFEFCKRQLLHQFPNLGVDVANMAMDPSFAEEEEAMKEGEDPVSGVAPNV
ncbi:hypothetical protein Acr_12g0007280 [Actinidia rufa]|uniref:Uncharacterized protein n=1 Tax=Actinidia rufa TaxID=165716 RepID=A0A7J0FJT7_9ERIC|nr:hypothetical protein Acr_12g0007280 [Actinidia rufa]